VAQPTKITRMKITGTTRIKRGLVLFGDHAEEIVLPARAVRLSDGEMWTILGVERLHGGFLDGLKPTGVNLLVSSGAMFEKGDEIEIRPCTTNG
jgi:hypothetical protein